MTSILLIEDDAWLAELEAGVLERAGFKVLVASNGLDAIDMVESGRPDVIVADVLLAGSTVFALLHEMQSYKDTDSIPVILCTNLAEQLTPVELKSYGVKRVVNKTTMDPAELVAAVRSVLE